MIAIKTGYRIIGSNKVPLIIDFLKSPHWLVCGASGSGKSYLLKYLCYSLLKYQSQIEIYVFDFKNSGDYEFMDAEHYAVGADCVEMFKRFYERYQEIKNNNLSDKIMCLFDEFAAFNLWLTGYDKKLGKEISDYYSEILMMGRSLGSNHGGAYIWTILQRPDAAYLGNARENFMIKIVMRDVTRSIRTMLEIEEDEIPKGHIALTGHGIAIVNNETYAFMVPTYDSNKMELLLKAKRSEAFSRAGVATT